MNPGVTIDPLAFISLLALSVTSPILKTKSSCMPMSALNLGEPVPSMTVPFRIMRSSNVISPRKCKSSNFPELDEHTFVRGVTCSGL